MNAQKFYNSLMAIAYTAATWSPDPSSQNGALILCSNLSLVYGYNHFYSGFPPEVEDRNIKLQRIEHAERDVIYQAAKEGQPTKCATMICPWSACYDCARGIVGSGIKYLWVHKERQDLTDPRWKDQVNESLSYIINSGVIIDYVEGPVETAPNILISGRLWSPERLEYVDG